MSVPPDPVALSKLLAHERAEIYELEGISDLDRVELEESVRRQLASGYRTAPRRQGNREISRHHELAEGELLTGEVVGLPVAGGFNGNCLPLDIGGEVVGLPATRGGPGDSVFVTRTGSPQTITNVDHRLKSAIKAANKQLAKLGMEQISDQVSPHSLRRTYASLRAALRDDPGLHRGAAWSYRSRLHLPRLSEGREAPREADGRLSRALRQGA